MDTGAAIKELRKTKSGMNQTAFSKAVGISQTYLSQLENNRKKASTEVLERIALQLGIPLPILFWLAVEEEDIKLCKLEHFRVIKPIIDPLIKCLI